MILLKPAPFERLLLGLARTFERCRFEQHRAHITSWEISEDETGHTKKWVCLLLETGTLYFAKKLRSTIARALL